MTADTSTPSSILVSWSSGKDSAWSLHLLQQDPAYQVSGLLTTLNTEFNRVAMHSTRREVLKHKPKPPDCRFI